jgi:DNA mismatch repair protein MutS2
MILESFVQNRRVLAVLAMYRRKVKVLSWVALKLEVLPTSNQATLQYSRELSNLEYEEKRKSIGY